MKKSALLAASLVLSSFLGFHSLRAGTAVRMEIEELVHEADLVFEGRVLSTKASRDSHGLVRTTYTVSVQRTFEGAPQGTRTFDLPGGVMPDGSGTVVPGVARLEVGEDVLLFLSEQSDNGLRMTVGLAQGKFRVVHDSNGERALERTHGELLLLDPSSGVTGPAPSDAQFDYGAVIARVQNAAAYEARRAQEVR